ncbi:uncharacterized protein LOC108628349 [Ceratina calcarata]|uniref:NADH dehydrogenase [ubiquinone] 1 beta subcomplex subunit 4 n=1 Tax=Ceratina calcarata TaxID=156304 RepID=A0AAJ7WDG9_9HYME|nr:uncharacterized protein LOC108628349 [Ceratina calcarata]
MSSKIGESLDLSKKMKEILEWRHARRKQLRHEYLKETLNPMKQTMPVETSMERFAMLRLRHEYVTKMTARHHLTVGFIFFGVLIGSSEFLIAHRAEREKTFRSGVIKYADREPKFH